MRKLRRTTYHKKFKNPTDSLRRPAVHQGLSSLSRIDLSSLPGELGSGERRETESDGCLRRSTDQQQLSAGYCRCCCGRHDPTPARRIMT
eukprot:scaffold365041_cov29-Prasinocladus_malaysianus.AAC.1